MEELLRAHFDTEIPPVDVVPEKEVASVGWFTANFEQLHEVILRSCRM